MRHLFRKSHRFLAPIIALPLVLTVLTGMAATVAEEWPLKLGLSSRLLLKVHTGEIFWTSSSLSYLERFRLARVTCNWIEHVWIVKKKKNATIERLM